jgi:hypothetical protein
MTRPRKTPNLGYAPGRDLVELLYGEAGTQEGRDRFWRHCHFLAVQAWNAKGEEQRVAEIELIKLFWWFVVRRELSSFRSHALLAFRYCKLLRESNPTRFEAARAAKPGRPDNSDYQMGLYIDTVIKIEQGLKPGKAIKKVSDTMNREEDTIHKSFYQAKKRFSDLEIRASLALRKIDSEKHSTDDEKEGNLPANDIDTQLSAFFDSV